MQNVKTESVKLNIA